MSWDHGRRIVEIGMLAEGLESCCFSQQPIQLKNVVNEKWYGDGKFTLHPSCFPHFCDSAFRFCWSISYQFVIRVNEFLVSKETVVLRRRERSKQKFGFIKRVDKGWITTVKDLESWRQLSKSFTFRNKSCHVKSPLGSSSAPSRRATAWL